LDELKVEWGIKARRFEHKIKSGRVGNLTSWEEKKKNEWRMYIGGDRKG